MKNTVLAILFIVLAGCGNSSGLAGRLGRKTGSNKVLSGAEKKILATTTVYYIETFTEAEANQCDENLKVNILDRKDQVFTRACKKVSDSCAMEGTCRVWVKNKMLMLSYDGVFQNTRRFRNITNATQDCKYGYGASIDSIASYKAMCVDPFFSVAADLSIYHLGDVIYLPSVQGIVLPTGEIHDGYFIVRDTGGAIDGEGRFDFFTGFFTMKNLRDSFVKLKLNDEQSFPNYFLIDGDQAERIRKQRNFPLLPKIELAKNH